MESDRLWRLLHVWERACCAFDDPASARDWLYEPSALLGGEAPGAHLDTEPGLREVEDMLTVIDETGTA
jgi:putative toxin-antitoxin system antitoxin component (TIGR02293 family)